MSNKQAAADAISKLRWMTNEEGPGSLTYFPVNVDSGEYQDFIADPKNKDKIV